MKPVDTAFIENLYALSTRLTNDGGDHQHAGNDDDADAYYRAAAILDDLIERLESLPDLAAQDQASQATPKPTKYRPPGAPAPFNCS